MKRLRIVFSLIALIAVLALPTAALADSGGGPTPAGWTWDES